MNPSFHYVDCNLNVAQTVWDELKMNKHSIPFNGVVAAARDAISRGGAFIVYSDTTSDILRRCDRPAELEEAIGS